MKTKITLLVTVIAAALLVGGCASTDAKTFLKADLHLKNGVWHHEKLTDSPVTGRIVLYEEGALNEDFFVKNGLKHGPYLDWHDGGPKPRVLGEESVYENGKLISHKKFWFTRKAGLFFEDKNYQVMVPGWNKDGTPVDPGKEK